MDGPIIEPRTALWAVAEVWWDDPTGKPLRSAATLEDTSLSGACLRLKTPITIGSRLTVKWHRENFSAVARNCRRDGREFLLGVRRDPTGTIASTPPYDAPPSQLAAASAEPARSAPKDAPAAAKLPPAPAQRESAQPKSAAPSAKAEPAPVAPTPARTADPPVAAPAVDSPAVSPRSSPVPRSSSPPEAPPPPHERKVMLPKSFFPNFWRRQQDATSGPEKAINMETPVNKSQPHPAESLTGSQSSLLSYDDIYHAAGILTPRSGYGVHKVVDMLNSDRIRELSKDIKRASVIMALDAAGTSPDDLLKDATHRQQALNSYEAGQQKQLEEFEARKAQENTKIQAEMDRVTAHYAERIKQNLDEVAREKEALRNWQMAKQHESQRISEVIELCAKQPASAPLADPQPAPSAVAASAASPASAQPNLSSKASAGH